MSEQQWIKQLEKEGFRNIFICPNKPNTQFSEHTHDHHTVHVILQGELILFEKNGTKVIREGERVEFPAGTTHNTKCGPEGCTFIVGEK